MRLSFLSLLSLLALFFSPFKALALDDNAEISTIGELSRITFISDVEVISGDLPEINIQGGLIVQSTHVSKNVPWCMLAVRHGQLSDQNIPAGERAYFSGKNASSEWLSLNGLYYWRTELRLRSALFSRLVCLTTAKELDDGRHLIIGELKDLLGPIGDLEICEDAADCGYEENVVCTETARSTP